MRNIYDLLRALMGRLSIEPINSLRAYLWGGLNIQSDYFYRVTTSDGTHV